MSSKLITLLNKLQNLRENCSICVLSTQEFEKKQREAEMMADLDHLEAHRITVVKFMQKVRCVTLTYCIVAMVIYVPFTRLTQV